MLGFGVGVGAGVGAGVGFGDFVGFGLKVLGGTEQLVMPSPMKSSLQIQTAVALAVLLEDKMQLASS